MSHIDSYYNQTILKPATFEALKHSIDVDVVVIGGGLAGLTTARELLKHGKSVALLEGNEIGWGASGRNGGFVSNGYAEGLSNLEKKLGFDHARALYDISCEGTEYVRNNISTFAKDGQSPEHGWLSVVRHNTGDDLKKSVEQMAKYGAEHQFLPTSKVREQLVSDQYHQGLLDKSAFHIHPLNYTQALAADTKSSGGSIYTNTEARTLTKAGSSWKVTTATGGTVAAEQVVLCGSAYLHDLYPKIERAVLPVATYVVTSSKMKSKLQNAIRFKGCISDNRRAGDYYRIIEDGQRLLWGGRITTQKSEPRKLSKLLKEDIEAIYPQLDGIEIEKAWSGLMGYCTHKMPVLKELEPGIWTATATGGHGLNSTAAIGIVVAEAITGVSDRYRHFSPFDAEWGGGRIGRITTQLAYWGMQLQDWKDERVS